MYGNWPTSYLFPNLTKTSTLGQHTGQYPFYLLLQKKTLEKVILLYITQDIPNITTQHGFETTLHKHSTTQHQQHCRNRFQPTHPTHTVTQQQITANSTQIHCSIVQTHLLQCNHNKLIQQFAPKISPSELPRETRRTLAQLRTNKSPILISYLHKVAETHYHSPLCLLCKTHSHTIYSFDTPIYLKQHTGPLNVSRQSSASASQVEGTSGRTALNNWVVGPVTRRRGRSTTTFQLVKLRLTRAFHKTSTRPWHVIKLHSCWGVLYEIFDWCRNASLFLL